MLPATGANVGVVVTDLCILEPCDGSLALTRIHPGATIEDVRAATGWELQVASDVRETEPLTSGELAALRELVAR